MCSSGIHSEQGGATVIMEPEAMDAERRRASNRSDLPAHHGCSAADERPRRPHADVPIPDTRWNGRSCAGMADPGAVAASLGAANGPQPMVAVNQPYAIDRAELIANGSSHQSLRT